MKEFGEAGYINDRDLNADERAEVASNTRRDAIKVIDDAIARNDQFLTIALDNATHSVVYTGMWSNSALMLFCMELMTVLERDVSTEE